LELQNQTLRVEEEEREFNKETKNTIQSSLLIKAGDGPKCW
jgi:hypothetical protein